MRDTCDNRLPRFGSRTGHVHALPVRRCVVTGTDRVTLADTGTMPACSGRTGGALSVPYCRENPGGCPFHYPGEVPPVAPAVGAWCELTRGFWTGGRYIRAGDLRPGHVFRWHTFTGFVVVDTHPGTGPGTPTVCVHTHGRETWHSPYLASELLELIPQTAGPDGWPLGVHGPGRWAQPCTGVPFTDGTDVRRCGHPLGEHGAYGCEHIGHGSGNQHRPDSLHGCACSVPWHGGVS